MRRAALDKQPLPSYYRLTMPATAPSTTAIPSSYRLAKLTGFHRAHVHRVLHADSGATLDCAIRLARAAGISLDELAELIYKDSGFMAGSLQRIDDQRADWLNEEAKKRSQSHPLSASNGSAKSSKPSKRRRK